MAIIPMTREQMQNIERRGEERVSVQQPFTHLSHRHSDLVVATQIIGFKLFRCVVLNVQAGKRVVWHARYPRDLALHLEDEEGEFKIECLIFDVVDAQIRALFKHGSFEVGRAFIALCATPKRRCIVV